MEKKRQLSQEGVESKAKEETEVTKKAKTEMKVEQEEKSKHVGPPEKKRKQESFINNLSLLGLKTLNSKAEIDDAIWNTVDKVLVLRFGREMDSVCMQLDETLAKSQHPLKKMAEIYCVEVDKVPEYIKFFDITLIPATIFFFNTYHMKCDFYTQDHTKWIGAFTTKQDFIDLIETFFRGAMKGKFQVESPIKDPSHIPKYNLIYKGI